MKFGAVLLAMCALCQGALAFRTARDAHQVIPLPLKGPKRIGDSCESLQDCQNDIPGSVCDFLSQTCNCSSETPVRGSQMCGRIADINETCSFSAQCRTVDKHRECRHQRCQCKFRWKPILYADGHVWCIEQEVEVWGVGSYVDPTMFGVLAGLILMFIIMCVVLRLFSKARWRENRTIFNTPNPRLMNASLLKDSSNSAKSNRRDSLTRPSRHPSLMSIARSPNGTAGPSGLVGRPTSPRGNNPEESMALTKSTETAIEVQDEEEERATRV